MFKKTIFFCQQKYTYGSSKIDQISSISLKRWKKVADNNYLLL